MCARGMWSGRISAEKFADRSFRVANRKYWCKFVRFKFFAPMSENGGLKMMDLV
jgi:hypothetical protein